MSNFALRQLKRSGWRIIDKEAIPNRCVICVAPHTSNWDFIWAILYKRAMRIKANFFMKKEWFRFPMGYIMKKLGGIPIDRSQKHYMTDIMAAEFSKHDIFRVALTPEGTRKANAQWKLGFYFIALKAQVPIVLAKIDYVKKEIGCSMSFLPTGNVELDLQKIKDFYSGVFGKKPANFVI